MAILQRGEERCDKSTAVGKKVDAEERVKVIQEPIISFKTVEVL